MYSSLIFVPKLILLAYFLNFGVLISKKIGAIFSTTSSVAILDFKMAASFVYFFCY